MKQRGIFDYQNRLSKLDERDPLKYLDEYIDWELFRPSLEQVRKKNRKSNAGRKPHDVLMMFKGLILQELHNLSDEQLEYQIRDRLTFSRFLGLSHSDTVPDANSFWDFREALKSHDLVETLFEDFNTALEQTGYRARKGQIIDASFVEVPKQRNSREENETIKQGEIPESFQENPNQLSQKDCDARWAKKNQETHYGYKDHVCIDNEQKLIRAYAVTDASVHDSNVCGELLTDNTSADVWADSAYRSAEQEAALEEAGYRSHLNRKGKRNQPLNDREKEANRKRSKVRARVEHVFGSMTNEQGGMIIRTIGLARAKVKIGLKNLVYNIRRAVLLCRKDLFAT